MMITRRALAIATIAMLALPTPLLARAKSRITITLSQAWARETAPGQSVGGGFLIIQNRGRTADRLLSGATAAARDVEIHTMTMEGDVMQMRKLADGLEIPAGATIMLKPGSYHVMFMDLKAPLAKGTELPVTLRFARAGDIRVTFRIQPIGAMEMDGHHHDHH